MALDCVCFALLSILGMMSAMGALMALGFRIEAAYPGHNAHAGNAKWEAIFASRHVPAESSLCLDLTPQYCILQAIYTDASVRYA